MRRSILVLLVLVGCQVPATGEKAATLVVLSEVCNTYRSALRVLIPFRAAGRLSDSEVAEVDDANEAVGALCMPGSPVPGDPLEAISTVNQKTVTLLLMRERKEG